ncbi:hypothetical protein GQ464_005035 [Rhodocaloribacter litoris]|uniref:hypothetical protein n=1 Tax=Rhodocaloribacter litoris TaxID=2558931 RepID=UPI001422ED16|nr:hypothetical protein [Rhodocaloribacter litoris]QXD16320.1 hypothetical protein GQ464_005035 [Rhodocaloribacter litoris]
MNRKDFLRLMAAGAMSLAAGRVPAPGPRPRAERKHFAWLRGDFSTMEPWKPKFARWKAAGIDALLPNVSEPDVLARVAEAAAAEGLETHAWIVTMMRGGMEEAHPEWYAVNRLGQSTATDPPYVPYYKFLCPNREPVRAHLADHYGRMGEVPGVASLHLDYIRFPDVILPVALWDTYGLVQDKEYPAFDYCYCDVCRAKFKAQTGLDPLDLDDPPSNEAWVRFRYDSITEVVTMLADVAHAKDRALSAAVFPTPAIARRLVRQDWPRWPLDAVHPMIYHSFYNEPVSWIEQATREGVAALGGRIPLYAGLYVPELSPAELAEAARGALAGGADGITLFEAQHPTEAHWQQLAPVLAS